MPLSVKKRTLHPVQKIFASQCRRQIISAKYPVHLAVLDGFRAMEGRGLTAGKTVNLNFAVASTDFIVADSVGARIMGFAPEEIGYLHHAIINGLGEGSLERISVLGDPIESCRRSFEPHLTYARQKTWKREKVEALHTFKAGLREQLHTG